MAELPLGRLRPHAAVDQGGLARQLGVETERVAAWLAAGLPGSAEAIDPIVACAWLGRGRIDESPVLRRRWVRFLGIFDRQRRGDEGLRRVRWRRRQRWFGPDCELRMLDWWLPEPSTTGWQRVDNDGGLWTDHCRAAPDRGGARLVVADPPPVVIAEGALTLSIAPQRQDLLPGERRELTATMRAVVAGSGYAFRRHCHDESSRSPHDPGSCLDLARRLAALLTAEGRESRLCGGVVADDAVAGAHFWLEVEVAGGGWACLDPTPAAVAGMLGRDPDDWIEPWVGACDSRRIQLGRGPHPLAAGAEPVFLNAVPGEAWVEDTSGRRWNAWSGQDWVLGSNASSFQAC